jgi:hypothetical protein
MSVRQILRTRVDPVTPRSAFRSRRLASPPGGTGASTRIQPTKETADDAIHGDALLERGERGRRTPEPGSHRRRRPVHGGSRAGRRSARARITLHGGKVKVTDGPFAEAKELIAGFAILDVKSKDEAVEHASRFAKIVGATQVDVRLVAEF